MKKNLVWISLLVIVALSACSGSSSPSLVGDWKLVSYNSTPALPEVDTNITFDAERMGGSVGCNSFGGDYKVSGATITFGPVMSTMMACDEKIMQQEGSVLGTFVETVNFKMDGNTLTITSTDGKSTAVLVKK